MCSSAGKKGAASDANTLADARGRAGRPGRGRATSRRAFVALGLGLVAAGMAGALAGCSGDDADDAGDADADGTSTDSTDATDATADSADPIELIDTESLFSDRDLEGTWDEDDAEYLVLDDAGPTIDGAGASIEGSVVTIEVGGTYVVTGSLSDGQLVVDTDDEKVQLVLAGMSLSTTGAAALLVQSADKVFVTLAEGTQNTLAATGTSEATGETTIDGALFSRDDLTINGTGALTVTSSQGHGIVGKDELTICGGELTVEAAGHAIQANDSVAISDGTLVLEAGTDGIHAENEDDLELGYIYVGGGSLTVVAVSDGLDASSILQVDGGTLAVAAGDDGLHAEYDLAINGGTISIAQSYEGIEGSTISITGGTIDVTSSDDGLNAAGEPQEGTTAYSRNEVMDYDETAAIYITGGTLTIDASGDGIDSNGDLAVAGGTIMVSGPTSGADGALDYTGTGEVTGGTVVAAGTTSMAQNFGTSSSQPSMLVGAQGSAGSTISLADADGTELVSFAPAKAFSCVVISTPDLEVGETYTLTVDGSSTSIELSDTIYTSVSGGFSGGTVMGNNGTMGNGMGQIQQMSPQSRRGR